MIDSTTRERITVTDFGTGWPYIMVPIDQLEAVETVLREKNVSYWVDEYTISLNGKPAIVTVTLGRDAIADRIQELLDSAG